MASENDEKYVLKHEHEADKARIYKKINENKIETDRQFSHLDKILSVFVESQKPIQQGFRDVKEELTTLNSTMSNFKESNKDLENRVKGLEDSADSKSQHNTKIWVAIIGACGVLGTAALGFAQIFF